MLSDFGCDLDKTYFDVPRLRVVTSDSYLTAGVGYAYKPHRDLWYAGPTSQINWWLPVYPLEEERALALYPSYWDRPIRNLSREFDHDEWCRVGRRQAASQIKEDTRKHPRPEEEIDADGELRIVSPPGSLIYFSAAHLHGTVPNRSGLTRFSIDFRTVHLDDVLGNAGAPNPDSEATGTAVADYLRATDFAPIPEEVVHRELSSVDG